MTRDEQVQWLYDRAQISDLMNQFAENLDRKDWQGYADLFTADGVLEKPWGSTKQAEMVEVIPQGLGYFHVTHHIVSNLIITIDGDAAKSSCYLQAMHVLDPQDQSTQWLVGGRYDNDYVRTPDGWKMVRVKISVAWQDGVRPKPPSRNGVDAQPHGAHRPS